MTQGSDIETRLTAIRLGYWAGLTTAALSALAFAVAFATPPRSGPNCTLDECVSYPYTDIAPHFPRDYLWMFPATLVLFAFLAFVVCMHYYAPPARRPFTLIATALAAIAAALIAADYFIQLTVVQPSVLQGEVDGLSLWSQYNPHGIFIALEALGYLLICAALACSAPAFGGVRRLERAIRWLFVLAFVLALGALVGLYAGYGQEVEYRFEIAVISVAWTALIAGGTLGALVFRRARPEPHRPG